jgi:phospholipid/cholesterol/gamma-HCH transport system permease protein
MTSAAVPRPRPAGPFLRGAAAAIQAPLDALAALGRSVSFLVSSGTVALTRPFEVGRVVEEVHFVGTKSLVVIVLTAAFTGMVLGLQGYFSLRRFGSEALLGPAVALSLVRELGPVLAALMVTARAGSAMTAEIGIMRITEQIDALEVMAVDPRKYLVAPRIAATVIVMPLLTSIFDLVGIWGGYLIAVKLLGLGAGTYFGEMRSSVDWLDLRGGLVKAACFGVIVAGVCTWKGYRTGQGAEGVGRATTQAVVASSVLILISDYLLTSLLHGANP